MYCKKENSFTLVEVMMALFIVSITLAAAVSMLTKMNHKSVGIDSNTINCIQSNAADLVFNTATGNITGLPTSGSCYAAYYGCMNGKKDICNTLFSYADGAGNADQTISALKILRASCDNGGDEACSYFNTRCYTNSTNCYSPDQRYTLRYYLNLSNTTANAGRSYIETTGIDYYKWNMSTYNNEISTVCPTCPGASTACVIRGCGVSGGSCAGGTLLGSLCVASADESIAYKWSPAGVQCGTKGTGWRLPSIVELTDMYNNKDTIGGFKTGSGLIPVGYWAAAEYNATYSDCYAFYVPIGSPAAGICGKDSDLWVRCVK